MLAGRDGSKVDSISMIVNSALKNSDRIGAVQIRSGADSSGTNTSAGNGDNVNGAVADDDNEGRDSGVSEAASNDGGSSGGGSSSSSSRKRHAAVVLARLDLSHNSIPK
jgi:hypothetical protein